MRKLHAREMNGGKLVSELEVGELDAREMNGRKLVSELEVGELHAREMNGRKLVSELEVRELDAREMNGRKLVSDLEVRELDAREMNGGDLVAELDARGMNGGEQVAGEVYAGEMCAEDQVAAMEAVNSAVAGARELVVGREDMFNSHDRELAAPVQVEAVDDGPSTFVFNQNRITLLAIQLDATLILPATFQNW